MINFENIEDLVAYMFENLDDENDLVSVISNKEMTIEILHELLNYESVILKSCEIDYDTDYGREYIVSLFNDEESDNWYVNVEKGYLEDNNKYLVAGGYVLFHEDVNSKALVDMQNNEFMPLGNHDWFVIGEDEETDNADETDNSDENDVTSVNSKAVKTGNEVPTSKAVYKVNGRNVTKEEFEKAFNDIEDRYLDNMKDMLLRYTSFMDDWNDILRLVF